MTLYDLLYKDTDSVLLKRSAVNGRLAVRAIVGITFLHVV